MSRGSNNCVAVERVVQVVGMIRYFEAGGIASTCELSKRFEMNPRSVQRWIAVVSEFVPLIYEDRKWRRVER